MSSSDSPTDEIERLTRLLRERDAEIARMRTEATGAEALITHLRLTIAKMRRELFGPRSEHKARLLDQMELQLEELEATVAEDEFAAEKAAASAGETIAVAAFARHKPARKPFPAHLPRERIVLLGPDACACCGSKRLAKLGEDVTETLEVVPRQWKVMQYVREKFTCRDCERITQVPAPFHVLPRGFAGPSLLAMILFEKYGQHQPLNRQSERYAREGIELSLSTLADQVGGCAALLRPLHDLIRTCSPASASTATKLRCRCLPRGRRRLDGPGSMCATIVHSADTIRQRRCSSTRATAPASTPSVTCTAMAASCRPTATPASTVSTRRAAREGRSPRPPAGRMHDASSSCSPTSPPRRAANLPSSPRWRSRR
jgi:transposase